ncbi:MAG TPA: hypothetical protein VM912_20590 [Terriglobales bacterium]|nr:hypothetical protein [Terriglobales bacterium]
MSGINCDKEQFHRDRKKKIARRKRKLELLNLTERPKSATPLSGSKPQAVKV